MKLYSGPLSLFTGKVRVALDEKGLAHEIVSVPFSRTRGYQPKHPEVLATNPKGQVPVLVDRSEERRVGKECRRRRSREHQEKERQRDARTDRIDRGTR